MDIQFQDHDLGAYFNEKYINVRIDMDSQYGEAIRTKYDVFFLPTLLILDKHGNAKYVSEGSLSSDELLSIGSYHHNAVYNPGILASTETSIETTSPSSSNETTASVQTNNKKPSSNPATIKSKDNEIKIADKETSTIGKLSQLPSSDIPIEVKPEETIIYTQDQASKNPDYLFNLTYLKLQLQDGSHWAAANDYLKTQENWTTEKNMRFIYDFVRSTQSDKFKHIVNNREEYNALFSKESVDRSISIMVNLSLFQRYPRPDKDESLELFTLLDPDVADVATFNYMLNRYEVEQNYHDYVLTALDYLKTNADDFMVIEKVATFYEDSAVDIDIEEIIDLTKNAIEIQGGSYYKLYDALANLYYLNKNKRKALQTIKLAKEIAIQNNVDTGSIDRLHERIKAL